MASQDYEEFVAALNAHGYGTEQTGMRDPEMIRQKPPQRRRKFSLSACGRNLPFQRDMGEVTSGGL